MVKKRKGWHSPFRSTGRGVVWNTHLRSDVPKQPVARKFLTASNEFWSETSLWEKKDGIWRCVSATGVLERLKGMNPAQAKVELLRLGAEWKWS